LNRAQRFTLPELLVKKTHLHWYTVTTIFALLLLAGLIITAIVSDTPFSKLGWNFWRVGLQGPAIIIYILIIYPILTKMGDNAVESIIPWVDLSPEELARLDSKYRVPSRLWESISLSTGIVVILILSQPWRGAIKLDNIFLFITEMIMFGLLSLLIYYGFHNARYMTYINKRLKLDLFNMDALAPIARWSLSISLAFIGGIALSIIFQNIDNLKQWQVILIYIIIIISTVAMFFISLWSTHLAIMKVKKHELAIVQEKYTQACRKMMQQTPMANNIDRTNSTIFNEVAAWALYERRIRETKEWPYNAGIIRQLIISIASSGVIYVVKLFWGNFPG
jgi:hypothetical protein